MEHVANMADASHSPLEYYPTSSRRARRNARKAAQIAAEKNKKGFPARLSIDIRLIIYKFLFGIWSEPDNFDPSRIESPIYIYSARNSRTKEIRTDRAEGI